LVGSLAGAIGGHAHSRTVGQGNLETEADIPGSGVDHGKPDATEVLENIQHDAVDADW
jgi:hypothetical protein